MFLAREVQNQSYQTCKTTVSMLSQYGYGRFD